ncbi:hypothetical protein [Nitrosopumilus sp.]|uniref:hypothetical protein n=1 Tax=Nitrosopumilus sp. TaxID=2024843 RepID=UPI00292CA704|nr:hypothetical protein [Nitrosopumilus sp.]
MIRTKKTKDRAMPDGPLESVFPVASSKILDFMSTYKPWDYSITDIAKNSGVTFKTAWSEVQKLEKLGLITNTRTVGNATMYQFNAESQEAQHIDRLINAIATRRIDEKLASKKKITIKPKVARSKKKK